tara:strand:+ start:1189 stop:1491 length:303 start_codon:yes stop_codon:yes gene_type:complete
MKPLKQVGKDEPKGWETPQDSVFPIVPEPTNDNELPVPYYDSDDYDDDTDASHEGNYGDTDTDYGSDTGSAVKVTVKLRMPQVSTLYKTIVKEETDFLDE